MGCNVIIYIKNFSIAISVSVVALFFAEYKIPIRMIHKKFYHNKRDETTDNSFVSEMLAMFQ